MTSESFENKSRFENLKIPEGCKTEIVNTPDGPCPITLGGEGKEIVLILRGVSNYAHPAIEKAYKKNEEKGKGRDFDLWNEGELAKTILDESESNITVVTTQYQSHFYESDGKVSPKPLENYSEHLRSVMSHLRDEGYSIKCIVGESGGAIPALDLISSEYVEQQNQNLPEHGLNSIRKVSKEESDQEVPEVICMNAFLGLHPNMVRLLDKIKSLGVKADLSGLEDVVDQNSDYLLNLRMKMGAFAQSNKLHFLSGESTKPVVVTGKVPSWLAKIFKMSEPFGDGMVDPHAARGNILLETTVSSDGTPLENVEVPIAPNVHNVPYADAKGEMWHFYKPWATTAVPKILEIIDKKI